MSETKVMADYFSRCAEQGVMAAFDHEEATGVDRLIAQWQIRPHDKILEPGCGSGRLTQRLAECITEKGEVLGMDLAPGMIGKARLRALPGNIRFEIGSVDRIDRPDAWFDKVICFNVFPHFEDVPGVLREFRRVLKPGGELWINHLKSRETLNAFHAKLGPEVNRHQLPDNVTQRRQLTEAGFEILFLDNDENLGYTVQATKPV